MSFAEWSPSHILLVLFVVIGFIGQVAVLFYRMTRIEKRMTRMEEQMEKRDTELLALLDKRFTELRTELKDEIGDLRTELRGEIGDLRTELKDEIADLRKDVRQLNQNHIEHLAYHNRSHQGKDN